MTPQTRIILRALHDAFNDVELFAGWLQRTMYEDPALLGMLAVLELAWMEAEHEPQD